MPHHTKRPCAAPRVPADYAPKLVGHRVHLAWAFAGANWVLDRIDGDIAYLTTPLNGKPLMAKVSDLCFTHRQLELYQKHCQRQAAAEQRTAQEAVTP